MLVIGVLAGCGKPENPMLNLENFAKIKRGDSIAELENLLGKDYEHTTESVRFGNSTVNPANGTVIYIWSSDNDKKKILVMVSKSDSVVEAEALGLSGDNILFME
ncbi:MAG: hypothetical protein RBU25_20085 [Lentisphaeria bacterium]|jgi:hypothetical protein|nr:hypothetical protein [Lentisphaeria bacterium]